MIKSPSNLDAVNAMKLYKLCLGIFLVWLCCVQSTFAQVSYGEGLTPIEGVLIPKSQTSQPQAVKPGVVFKDCDECPEMVVIPSGSFLMGSPPDPEPDLFSNAKPVKVGEDNEKPQHRVNIQVFAIGKYEVTQEQWHAVMSSNPSQNKGRTLPVENVSWDDAQLFVLKLSQKTGKKYRLPSESEWEYAARAGSTTTYPWCDSVFASNIYAWSRTETYGPIPVGMKKLNSYNLYDMMGSNWEWTQDCWNNGYRDAPPDGTAWTDGNCSLRVVRGGSRGDSPMEFRSALRSKDQKEFRHTFYGLRVVRDL